MSKKQSDKRQASSTSQRDDRLKAALKANLQRRKAQARARADKNNGEKAG